MFRFLDLQIWEQAADMAVELDELAGELDERKKYRFAEQLQSAGLSISNNIAEGSGSNANKDFVKFLFIARKSAFECASMLMIFQRTSYCNPNKSNQLIADLEKLSKMIVSFSRTLT